MTKVDVLYLMKRDRGNGITAEAEDCITLNLENKTLEGIRMSGNEGDKSKSFKLLEEMLRNLAELKGFEFIEIELITEVGVYEYD